MTKPALKTRCFEVVSHTASPTHTTIHAAYWQVNGATSISTNMPEADGFTVFKDTAHQAVYAVRSDSVRSIREIVDRPIVDLDWDELRIASVALSNEGARGGKAKTKGEAEYHEKAAKLAKKFIDADRNVSLTPHDPVASIIERVRDGWISIDEAREELKSLPWDLPETGERREWS